jgi:hypothetical protein
VLNADFQIGVTLIFASNNHSRQPTLFEGMNRAFPASLAATTQPHRGHAAGGGRIPKCYSRPNGHSTALFAPECQFFLENVTAGFGQTVE